MDLIPNDADKPTISAVLMSDHYSKAAKAFWQHTGEGISSRRAEYCFRAFNAGTLAVEGASKNLSSDDNEGQILLKGPRRYQKGVPLDAQTSMAAVSHSTAGQSNGKDLVHFVEERFGRNLDIALSEGAKCSIRKRIAGAFRTEAECIGSGGFGHPTLDGSNDSNETNEDVQQRGLEGVSADDVYLYPCGMNAIFHAHQLLLSCRSITRSVNYGYVL